MDSLIITIIYIVVFSLIRQLYKRHIERKYNYIIPMKKKGFGVDRNITHFDEEVIHNQNLKTEIKNLFIAENIGVAIMIIGVMYSVLT